MAKKKLIDYHREWKRKKQIPEMGLCSVFDELSLKYQKTFQLFIPTDAEIRKLDSIEESSSFWASGLNIYEYDLQDRMMGYTPRRQAIILLICAMHNEL